MSTVADRKASATAFFWRWLIASSAASMIGNVAHAMFNSHNAGAAFTNAWVAACMSIAPPVVLAVTTHGLAVMVRSQITGMFFKVALALLACVAVCALVLSFYSLFELAVKQGGMPWQIAWLWPLIIDLSVAFSTLALLALTTGKKARREAAAANRPARKRPVKRAPAKPKAVPAVAA